MNYYGIKFSKEKFKFDEVKEFMDKLKVSNYSIKCDKEFYYVYTKYPEEDIKLIPFENVDGAWLITSRKIKTKKVKFVDTKESKIEEDLEIKLNTELKEGEGEIEFIYVGDIIKDLPILKKELSGFGKIKSFDLYQKDDKTFRILVKFDRPVDKEKILEKISIIK
ncbi:MAG: hypothetical protein QXO40_00275 [Candidatus Aenigmatarchaeota archaeon]